MPVRKRLTPITGSEDRADTTPCPRCTSQIFRNRRSGAVRAGLASTEPPLSSELVSSSRASLARGDSHGGASISSTQEPGVPATSARTRSSSISYPSQHQAIAARHCFNLPLIYDYVTKVRHRACRVDHRWRQERKQTYRVSQLERPSSLRSRRRARMSCIQSLPVIDHPNVAIATDAAYIACHTVGWKAIGR